MARFSGGRVSFDDARFIGGEVVFDRARFSGGGEVSWGPFPPLPSTPR
jgi:hypothetical protein